MQPNAELRAGVHRPGLRSGEQGDPLAEGIAWLRCPHLRCAPAATCTLSAASPLVSSRSQRDCLARTGFEMPKVSYQPEGMVGSEDDDEDSEEAAMLEQAIDGDEEGSDEEGDDEEGDDLSLIHI